jgi:hypothetical protein
MKFIEYLILKESPITDYKTFGDFSKNSSFKDKRDRFLITNQKTIEYVKKKFGKTEYNINMYFVNSAKAKKWSEVGKVDIEWVRNNLGDDVADHIKSKMNDDAINIIFTNNNGAERVNMTAWMMAHRLAHALANEQNGKLSMVYKDAGELFINSLNELFKCYNVPEIKNMSKYYYGPEQRNQQLLIKHIGQKICTFRSAREGIIRDWFEILNELIAQCVITGTIKFNEPPNEIKYNRSTYRLKDKEEAFSILSNLERDMKYMIDDILSSAVNRIFVM